MILTFNDRYEGDNYVLDQQVVRSALKSYRLLFSSKPPSLALLSPSTAYLRYLISCPSVPSSLSAGELRDPATAILLLEMRAALIVHDHAHNASNADASANQRVSRAVTEAFIATQVRGMLESLVVLPDRDRTVVTRVFLLVSSDLVPSQYRGEINLPPCLG